MEDENSWSKLMADAVDRDMRLTNLAARTTSAETMASNISALMSARYIEVDNKVRDLMNQVAILEGAVLSLTNRIQLHDEILNGKL